MIWSFDAGKTIRVTSPQSSDFGHSWKKLNEALLKLGLKEIATQRLCVVFEFDEMDAPHIDYEKYVWPPYIGIAEMNTRRQHIWQQRNETNEVATIQ